MHKAFLILLAIILAASPVQAKDIDKLDYRVGVMVKTDRRDSAATIMTIRNNLGRPIRLVTFTCDWYTKDMTIFKVTTVTAKNIAVGDRAVADVSLKDKNADFAHSVTCKPTSIK